MVRKENIRVVGFFGESGAGKTTIIRNLPTALPKKAVITNTGIIRYLFQKNGDYSSPQKLLMDHSSQLDTLKPNDRNSKIDEIFEKYVRGQFQLLNDYSTEVFVAVRDIDTTNPVYLLLDRSPIDFYAMTKCGIDVLISALGRQPSKTALHFLSLMKKTAEINTKNFFTHVIITKPWKDTPTKEHKDGIRDEYLAPQYRGENWYNRLNDCSIDGIKLFTIPESIDDLNERVGYVAKYMENE